MKAILLVGGKGTRLRPLTLHTPKPIVPIFNRPFLHYQIDLLKQVPEIDEVILSLNYQPRRIEDVFGDGAEAGIKIRYVVEPAPLGTGGAVRYAGDALTDSVVVFNGDVLTQVDLAAVLRLHRERKARATIVLTPVDNPTAYGLVETDEAGNILRFLEKPKPEEITTNYINAGIYILEPDTFDRIPKDTPWSIERELLPVVHRARRDVRRLQLQRLLDRHRHAGEVHAGAPRHHGRPVPGAAVCRPAGGARLSRRRRRASKTARSSRVRLPRRRHGRQAGARVGPYSVLGHAAARSRSRTRSSTAHPLGRRAASGRKRR